MEQKNLEKANGLSKNTSAETKIVSLKEIMKIMEKEESLYKGLFQIYEQETNKMIQTGHLIQKENEFYLDVSAAIWFCTKVLGSESFCKVGHVVEILYITEEKPKEDPRIAEIMKILGMKNSSESEGRKKAVAVINKVEKTATINPVEPNKTVSKETETGDEKTETMVHEETPEEHERRKKEEYRIRNREQEKSRKIAKMYIPELDDEGQTWRRLIEGKVKAYSSNHILSGFGITLRSLYYAMTKKYGIVWEQEKKDFIYKYNLHDQVTIGQVSTLRVVAEKEKYRSIFESLLDDLIDEKMKGLKVEKSAK